MSTIAKKIDTILDELKLRAKWFTPVEILRQGTSNGGKLLSLSNVKNPYKQGKLGVIEEGALANILLINGNPLEDLTLFHSPEENLALIMKDGRSTKARCNRPSYHWTTDAVALVTQGFWDWNRQPHEFRRAVLATTQDWRADAQGGKG